jgi:hypothetical protein
MTIDVRIPTILRPYTKDQKSVQATGSNLGALLQISISNMQELASDFLKMAHFDVLSTSISMTKMCVFSVVSTLHSKMVIL